MRDSSNNEPPQTDAGTEGRFQKTVASIKGYVFVNDTIATEAEMVAQIVKNKE